jgi:hypothetical protein
MWSTAISGIARQEEQPAGNTNTKPQASGAQAASRLDSSAGHLHPEFIDFYEHLH